MAESKIEVGQKAPAFALKNQDDKTVKLSDDELKGRWVVLYFYPKDDTPGCTKEACELRDAYTKIQETGAVLYGVLHGMGVWDKINSTANDLLQANEPGEPLISAGRVFGVSAIIGAVNIVLFTALATVGAFVYNVSADLAGGLELTLSERE